MLQIWNIENNGVYLTPKWISHNLVDFEKNICTCQFVQGSSKILTWYPFCNRNELQDTKANQSIHQSLIEVRIKLLNHNYSIDI